MIKVITYGTYDLLHYGHIRLLERAKALGDYLIVGVTADDFDKTRGKINVQQSLIERIEAVKATGLADEIIVEEYEGQKIDDIRRLDIDIFTVGSDWAGKFDYLNEYCKVVYLERTEGVSSSDIRERQRSQRLGLVGATDFLAKVFTECSYVNGMHTQALFIAGASDKPKNLSDLDLYSDDYDLFLENVDAVYIHSLPQQHYEHVKAALLQRKHVLCVSPIALSAHECNELFNLANENGCILMDAIKTAYSTAFSRLVLLAKSGRIGDIVAVEATCTSLKDIHKNDASIGWNSICDWGPTALLPIFQLFGTCIKKKCIVTKYANKDEKVDAFSHIDLIYSNGVATVNVGKGAKSEGELIITGTKGYIFVPAPWWKTDYFEIRYENPADNKRYFYQLDGEGIRYELVAFLQAINKGKNLKYIEQDISVAISELMGDYFEGIDLTEIL